MFTKVALGVKFLATFLFRRRHITAPHVNGEADFAGLLRPLLAFPELGAQLRQHALPGVVVPIAEAQIVLGGDDHRLRMRRELQTIERHDRCRFVVEMSLKGAEIEVLLPSARPRGHIRLGMLRSK